MAEAFISGTRPPDAGFATQLVQPPSALYVSPEEYIRLRINTTVLPRLVDIAVRLLLADGTVQLITHSFTTTGVNSYLYYNVPLAEGFLLSVQVSTSDTVVARGETYVSVELVRGTEAAPIWIDTLCAGYLTQNYGPVWPQGGVEIPASEWGMPRQFGSSDPAAGVEWSITVPFGSRWRIIAVQYNLVTDATVANRFPRLTATINGSAQTVGFCTTAITASTAPTIVFGIPVQFSAGTNLVQAAALVPGLILPAGSILATVTQGLQAGDNATAATVLVEEWKE